MKKILIPTIILAIVLSTVASAQTSGTQRQESNRNTSSNQRQETNRTTSNLRLPEENRNKNTSGTQRQESNRDVNGVTVSNTQLQTEKTKTVESNQKAISKADPVCAQTAVGKRDATIINALQKYTTDWITILNTRTASEKLAFLKTSQERIKDIRAANSIKATESEKVKRILTQSKNLAWDMFRLEIKACGFATNPL